MVNACFSTVVYILYITVTTSLAVWVKGLGPIWAFSPYNGWLLSRKWRPGDTVNEKIDDLLFGHHNDRVVIAPTVRFSPYIPPNIPRPSHLLHFNSHPSHSNANPCPEHKGSLCEVFSPHHHHHHPPLRSHPSSVLSPAVWLMCSICWMMDWVGQGKSSRSHTFPVHMAGRG